MIVPAAMRRDLATVNKQFLQNYIKRWTVQFGPQVRQQLSIKCLWKDDDCIECFLKPSCMQELRRHCHWWPCLQPLWMQERPLKMFWQKAVYWWQQWNSFLECSRSIFQCSMRYKWHGCWWESLINIHPLNSTCKIKS